jgi:hypothetical protein
VVQRVVRFARTPRMSTYILAMIVGKFDHIEGHTREGVRVRVYTTPGKSALGQFSLRIATETLSYFNEYFGTPFPLSKLDMIAVPDFAAGAMENWGLITYREIALLVDEQQTPAARRMRVAETVRQRRLGFGLEETDAGTAVQVAHELAHQWFGNLVTMEWWTHLWSALSRFSSVCPCLTCTRQAQRGLCDVGGLARSGQTVPRVAHLGAVPDRQHRVRHGARRHAVLAPHRGPRVRGPVRDRAGEVRGLED